MQHGQTVLKHLMSPLITFLLYRNEAVIANTIHNTKWYSFFLDVSVIYLYAVVSDRKGNIMLHKLYVFFRKETVLSIAVILALLSMFWVRPDKAYFTYIDFRTLGLLFCLMAIVAGLKAVGVFDILAQKLLMGTSGTVGVIRLLVLLCFFLSMVITMWH